MGGFGGSRFARFLFSGKINADDLNKLAVNTILVWFYETVLINVN